jgi:hypothetical protein
LETRELRGATNGSLQTPIQQGLDGQQKRLIPRASNLLLLTWPTRVVSSSAGGLPFQVRAIESFNELRGSGISIWEGDLSQSFSGWMQTRSTTERSMEPRLAVRVTGPVKAVLSILDRWRIDDGAASAMLGADEKTYVRGLRLGLNRLRSRDEQDRARMIIRIYEGLYSLVGNRPDAERRWLEQPRPELKDSSVLATMTEGSFASLMRAQAFVDFVNGR